jgi:hypothetical protein
VSTHNFPFNGNFTLFWSAAICIEETAWQYLKKHQKFFGPKLQADVRFPNAEKNFA